VQVNENFAINLVAEEPVSNVESRVVSCDGGGGALGHPKVYINLVKPFLQRFMKANLLLNHALINSTFSQDKETKVGTCGYCGLQFQQKHHH